MIIKTLLEVSNQQAYLAIDSSEFDLLVRSIWRSLETGMMPISLEKASFVKDLMEHQKDPLRILAMLLLNLSQKDLLEFRVALGIPELTLLS